MKLFEFKFKNEFRNETSLNRRFVIKDFEFYLFSATFRPKDIVLWIYYKNIQNFINLDKNIKEPLKLINLLYNIFNNYSEIELLDIIPNDEKLKKLIKEKRNE